MDLHGILHGLAYVALGTVLLVVARLLVGFALPYRLQEHLTKRDNPAVGLVFTGYLLGVLIIFLGASIGPEHVEMEDGALLDPTWGEIGQSMLVVAGYTLGGLVCLFVGTILLDRIVLRRFAVTDEVIRDRNAGTGAVVFGSIVATALVIAGAVHGEGGGPVTALAFFGLGQVVLVLWSLVYQAFSKFDLHEQIEKDNVAAGVAYGLSVVGVGVVLLRASKDHFVGWAENLGEFGYFALTGFVVLVVLRVVTDRVLMPGDCLHVEIERDRNLNAAWAEGAVAIGGSAMIFFMM
jgi:uncharacterized membrane protein YjfL (UPF0719 family)